jgi:hypothetical protein
MNHILWKPRILLFASLVCVATCSDTKPLGSADGSANGLAEVSVDVSTNGSADGATGCRSAADCLQPGNSAVSSWVCLLPHSLFRCGPVLPANEGVACTNNSQCGLGLACRATAVSDGGISPSGSTCVPAVVCTDDSPCGVGQVCREDLTGPLTLRVPSGFVCSPPCSSDLDCASTNKCKNGGHCQARTCEECPSYLSCASGSCVVPSCSTDADCSGGYCVAGRCAGSLGVCQLYCL